MSSETFGTPLYSQVANTLRSQIADGRWLPGQRLANEMQLAKELGVSRVTVRKAIAMLREEKVLTVQHGVGTFVLPARAQQTLDRLETLNTTLIDQGFEPVTQVVEFGFKAPSEQVRRALQIVDDKPVLHVRRLHSVADGPIGVIDLSVPAEVGNMWSRRDVEQQPFYQLLPAVGVTVSSARQVIRADGASRELAGVSGIAEGTPVLVCERTTFDDQDRPIVHAVFTYRSDRFEFQVTLRSEPASASWVPHGLAVIDQRR